MKKNKIMFILLFIFSFIFNLNIVLADNIEIEIKDGDSTYFSADYSNCKVTTKSNIQTIGVRDVNGGAAIYVKMVSNPKKPYSAIQEEITCTKNGTNETEKITVKVYGSAKAVSQETLDSFEAEDANNATENDNNSNNKTNSNSGNNAGSTLKNCQYDCNFILGDINDSGISDNLPSVAYVLNKILFFMKIMGPILVIVLTILDLVKAVASADKDALTKSLKTLSKRMIYAVLLFIFPTIIDFALKLTNVYGTCCIFGN